MKYIDLGLPSGTLWAENNEEGFYTFDEAVSKYGGTLPTREQLEELKAQCQWEWVGKGYKVIGPNDNCIVLPAKGVRYIDGYVGDVGFNGNYWSSTPNGLVNAWRLIFNSCVVDIYDSYRCNGRSVRLVKK